MENRRSIRSILQSVQQLDRSRGQLVLGDGIDQARASHQNALSEKLADSGQPLELIEGLGLGQAAQAGAIKRAGECGAGGRRGADRS